MSWYLTWWGTLILCFAAWYGTAFLLVWLYGLQAEATGGGQVFIAASINSIFALLFIHLVLK